MPDSPTKNKPKDITSLVREVGDKIVKEKPARKSDNRLSDDELLSMFSDKEPEKKNPSGEGSGNGSTTGISEEDKAFVNEPLPDQNQGALASESTGQDNQKTDPKYVQLHQAIVNQFKKEDKAREEDLKRQDTGQGRVSSFIGNIDQAFYNLPADAMETLAIGANQVGRATEALGIEDRVPVEEQPLYKAAQWYKNAIKQLAPDNPAYQDELQSHVGTAIGDLMSLVGSGGIKAGAKGVPLITKELQAFNKSGNLFSTALAEGKKLIGSPPAIVAAMQVGTSEFEQAKASGATDDQAFGSFIKNAVAGNVLEAIPIAHFFQRLDQTTGGGVKNAIKNGFTQGVEEMTTEVAQQVFSNVDAANTYDATREWYDGLNESGGIGFGLGFVLGAMGTSLRKKQSEAQTPEEKADIQNAIDFVDQKSEELAQKQTAEDEAAKENPNTEVQQQQGSTDLPQQEESASLGASEENNQELNPKNTEENAIENRIQQESDQLEHQGTGSLLQGEGNDRNVSSSEHTGSSETSSSDSVLKSGGKQEKEVQGKKEKVSKKERKATKKILEDPKLSKELKEGIKEDAKFYIPRTDKLNNHEANTLIEYKGLEQSKKDVLDFDNEMHPAVRVKMRKALIRKLDALASEARDARNTKLEKQFRDDAIQLSEEHGTKGTSIASALQAYKEHITDKSPSQVIYETEKMIKKSRKNVKQVNKSEIDESINIAKEHIKESSGEVLKSKRARAKIDKIRQKLISEPNEKKTEREIKITQKRAKVKENLQKAKDEFHSILKEIRGQANAGIDPRLVAAGAKYGYYAILDGSYKFSDWSKKMVDELGDAVKPYLEDIWDSTHDNEHLKSLANEVQIHDLNKNTRKQIIDNLDQRIEDIVGKHYTEVNRSKPGLRKKLMDGLEISEDDAMDLSNIIESEFEKLYQEKRKKTLEKKLGANKKEKPNRKTEQFHEELVKLVNMGALTDKDMSDLYMKKFDIPHLTEDQKGEITKIVEKIQSLPEGSLQQRKEIEKLLGLQTNLHGVSKLDVATSIWYASILSGPTTQLRNIWANTNYLFGEIIREGAYSLSKGDTQRFKLSMIGLYQGLGRGIIEAAATVKSGVSPDKTGKTEAPMLLERYNFKGGKFNPYNYAKYVSRLMSAADIFFYHGAKEMRAFQLALAEAKAEGKDLPSEALRNKVYEKLFKTSELKGQAEEQAKSEGLKGDEYKRRVLEIMDQKRGIEIADETRLYALKTTFNQDPEGTLGLITGLMSNASSRFIPLKFIVPFTRILSNVTNNYVDWSPYGFVRVGKNGIGWGDTYRKYSPEERAKVFISAMAGTLGMMALYSMTADDEDEKGVEITANLTGDFKKNYEINKPQYSVRFGKVWYNYQDTPLAIPLSIIGYIRDAEKYKGDKDLDERVSIAAFGTIKYMSDLTFMQGLSEFFDAFSKEGNEGAQSFFKKMEKQSVTVVKGALVPNAFTQTKRMIDEAFKTPLKQADGMLQQIYRDIPIANDGMHDMVNTLGEPVIPEVTHRLFPFQAKVHEEKPVLDLLNEKNAFIGRITRGQLEYQLGVAVSDDQYYEFCKKRGQEIKEKITKNFDKLKGMTPEEVREQVKKYKEKATKSAKFEVFKKLK